MKEKLISHKQRAYVFSESYMMEYTSHFQVKVGSEKNFGFIFCFIFFLYAMLPLFVSEDVRLWPLISSIVLLVITLFIPSLLSVPNKLWFKFGMFLGRIVSPLVMILLYFISVVPTGVIMRALGHDLLRQKLDKDVETYWQERKEVTSSMENQF